MESSNFAEALTGDFQNGNACKEKESKDNIHHTEISIHNFSHNRDTSQLTQRKKEYLHDSCNKDIDHEGQISKEQKASWRRILLLIIAITVHNIPGNILKRKPNNIIIT